ncbi:fusaric acid resistance protein FusB [Acetobacter orientalis NRIC 0481]|uniref:Fusaric acid resistance protein FusB n=3 Tax=Acetobacter orientalis TaxID=146474 RepID=A0A0D6NKZ2_9PROT|nr:fusaric acid resistance protein FusB [Acetobacter orientalis]GBR17163.1 fusaric acid resistance protein FusB [Acetobacter orientalis NRIC 0481]
MYAFPNMPFLPARMQAWLKQSAQKKTGFGNSTPPLAWLFAPSATNLGFALRTTCAALLALTLALWMEMDSPQWAAMTTWIVAQNSRGQSLSKARWRLIGTFIGAVCGIAYLAAFPQSPWLLFPLLALGAGACCAWATFLRNFRSYALVLVAFTCTIIVLSAANQPDNVFMIALSRTTYITLGILCENGLAMLFAPKLDVVAKEEIRTRLQDTFCRASLSMADLLTGAQDGLMRSRALFGSIPSLADQTEFSTIEMGPHSHAGDHTRAALAAISTFLARGVSLHQHMLAAAPVPENFKQQLHTLRTLLSQVPAQFNSPDPVQAAHNLRQTLLRCRTDSLQYATDYLTQFEKLRVYEPAPTPLMQELLECRILQAALAKLLLEFDRALAHFIATQTPPAKDHFRFDRQPEKDYTLAFYNGLRSAVAICLGGLLWEITAWPEGSTVAMFVAVTSTRFSSFENPVVASGGFLRGAVWAAFVSFFLVFLVLPQQASVETLLASLFLPMLVGGLALRAPNATGTAAAYNNFLPFMVGPANHTRLDELTWLNTTPAVVFGIALGVWAFRLVLPFNAAAERWRIRTKLVKDLRRLCACGTAFDTTSWMARSGNRLAQIIRHAGQHPDATTEAYLAGAMGLMTVGLLALRLHYVLAGNSIRPDQQALLRTVLNTIAHSRGYTLQPAHVATQALQTLLPMALQEKNLSVHLELTRAISSLEVMRKELESNATFLDTTRRFRITRKANTVGL